MDASVDEWTSLSHDIDYLMRTVKNNTAININSRKIRDSVKGIVQQYFRSTRLALIKTGFSESELTDVDSIFQELIRLSQGSNPKTSYVRLLKSFLKSQPEISVRWVRLLGQQETATGVNLAPSQQKILIALESLVPTAALSYQQVHLDLEVQKKISYRGTASELREVVREIVDRLAPDTSVTATPGFKLEKDRLKPTMRQKVRFILKARGGGDTTIKVPQQALDRMEEAVSLLARSIYDRGSLSTHVSTTRKEVIKMLNYVDAVLIELLEVE